MYTGSPRFSREILPPGDQGTDRTVERIRQVARQAVNNPDFIQFVQGVSLEAGKKDSLENLGALIRFFRDHWFFRRDPVGIELVKDPALLVSEFRARGSFVGDCDDSVTAFLAAASVLGYPARPVVVQRKPRADGVLEFDHIFLEVNNRGTWYPVDPIAHGMSVFFRPSGIRYKIYDVV